MKKKNGIFEKIVLCEYYTRKRYTLSILSFLFFVMHYRVIS